MFDVGTAPLAVITGASSGIGRATARQLAEAGFATLLIARRAERLHQLAGELAPHAPSLACPMDLSDVDAIVPTLGPILQQAGPVRVLVNNAGVGFYQSFLQHSMDDHHRLMQINYFAPLAMIRLVLPAMQKARRGHIINIASMSTKIGPWGHAGYASAKSALVSLTQTLAAEHGETGVNFSYVNPGIVATEFFSTPSFGHRMDHLQKYAIPPEQVAAAVMRLLRRPQLELCVPRYYRVLDLVCAISPRLALWLVRHESCPRQPSAGLPPQPTPSSPVSD